MSQDSSIDIRRQDEQRQADLHSENAMWQDGFVAGRHEAFNEVEAEAQKMFPTDKRSRDQVKWLLERIEGV